MKDRREQNDYHNLITPCYVIHNDILQDGIDLLKTSLDKYWNNYIVGYSFKTNSLPYVIGVMRNAGFHAEVVSEDEYRLARKYGFDNIIYNGPVKGRETFMDAILSGQIVNIDSKREVEWLKEIDRDDISVGIRVNFDIEALCPGETSAGDEGSRFGFSVESGELACVIDELVSNGINITGLHLHVGTKTRSVKVYKELARAACRLKRDYKLNLRYIDVGGGYFGGMENKPKFPDYVKAIAEELQEEFTPDGLTLIMEPGTSLITPPVEYITTVVDTKRTYANNLVTVDGSRIDVDPLHRKTSYFSSIEYNEPTDNREILDKQVICGFTCMEDDRLFTVNNEAELRPGDRIRLSKVGGYTMCLTPLFIRYFPAVYLEQDSGYSVIREAWGVEEYSRKCTSYEGEID